MSDSDRPTSPKTLKFRYVWPVKVSLKKLNHCELTVLHISPKWSTVFGHISFQWSLKLQQTQNLDLDDDFGPTESLKRDYVAISLYYLDGPVSSVELFANVGFVGGLWEGQENGQERIEAKRGSEVELSTVHRQQLSEYVTANMNKKIRVSVTLEMSADLFKIDSYLNAVSPTPFCSFLTTNYRARACSKVWKRKGQSFKRPRSQSEGQANFKKLDLERAFNQVLEMEDVNCTEIDGATGKKPEHLFKKILLHCCDTCNDRRNSIINCDEFEAIEQDTISNEDIHESTNEVAKVDAFECCQEEKLELHDELANMYFNKISLPRMEYIEDFYDFLIDAELFQLPVLKRACERYLCGELNTKGNLQTSILLNLLFFAVLFNLPIMKSMTLTELCERHEELGDVTHLLEQEDYKNLNNKIKQLNEDRSLQDLLDECKRFREQRLRVQHIF